MKKSNHFVGYIPPKEDTIADLREAVKGTGFRIKLYGRNPNRKQYYPEKNRTRNGYTFKSSFQQDLPREFSTCLAVYVVPGRAMNEARYGANYTETKLFSTREKVAIKRAQNSI
jgi:hypothetical protein